MLFSVATMLTSFGSGAVIVGMTGGLNSQDLLGFVLISVMCIGVGAAGGFAGEKIRDLRSRRKVDRGPGI